MLKIKVTKINQAYRKKTTQSFLDTFNEDNTEKQQFILMYLATFSLYDTVTKLVFSVGITGSLKSCVGVTIYSKPDHQNALNSKLLFILFQILKSFIICTKSIISFSIGER